jgi:hypothetical protein
MTEEALKLLARLEEQERELTVLKLRTWVLSNYEGKLLVDIMEAIDRFTKEGGLK